MIFRSERNELIYRVMRYLHDRDRPVDVVTIAEHFKKHNRLEDMGGVSYLTELSGSVPTAENVRHYAQIVRSQANRRRGRLLAEKIIAATEEDYESDEDYFAAIDELVDEIRPTTESEMTGLDETRVDYFRHLHSKAEKISSGFRQFDDWAGGLWRGWLFVLAGRPGAGKQRRHCNTHTALQNITRMRGRS